MSIVPRSSEAERADRVTRALVPPSAGVASTLARVVGVAPAAATELLERHGSLGALRRVDAATLRASHGLTARQTTRLRDALDLATQLLVEPRVEQPRITRPDDAARLVLPDMGLLEAEQMRLLLLDTKNRLIATVTLYNGTLSACQVRVAEVFREAIRHNAAALVVVHNHPSGAVDPSPEDVCVTREIVQAGRLLDVDVLDHLIIGRDAYLSLRERGRGWE